MGIGKFPKGVIEPYLIAFIFGTVAVASAGYWVYSSSRGGISTSMEVQCTSDMKMYCNYLMYGGTPPQWKEGCGDPPTLEECEAMITGEPIKCTPGGTQSCTKKCKGCVGTVCKPDGKSTTGTQTCQADETWGECNAVCENDCETDEECGALPDCGDGDLDAGEQCEPPNSDNDDHCPQEAECDYEKRKYGARDEYGDCDSNCQCVLDELDWGDADGDDYCANCAEHCGDGECNCEEDDVSCPVDCGNFKLELYGDYDWSGEWCSVIIEDDIPDGIYDVCLHETCKNCEWNEEVITDTIDTDKYCGDNKLEISFSDISYVDTDCKANHRACILVDDAWKCCENECDDIGGCDNIVTFNCEDWSCLTGVPPSSDCEDYPSHYCAGACDSGDFEDDIGTCPEEEVCCLEGPPSPEIK